MIKSRGNHWFVFVEGGGCDNNVVVINICSRVPRRVAWSHSVKSTGWRLGVKSMSVYAVYNKLVLGAAGRSGVTRRCCCHPSQCQTPLKGCPSLVNKCKIFNVFFKMIFPSKELDIHLQWATLTMGYKRQTGNSHQTPNGAHDNH